MQPMKTLNNPSGKDSECATHIERTGPSCKIDGFASNIDDGSRVVGMQQCLLPRRSASLHTFLHPSIPGFSMAFRFDHEGI